MTARHVPPARLAAVARTLKRNCVDLLLITNPINVAYLSGFEGHDAVILVGRSGSFFLTDSRYALDAKEAVAGYEIVIARKPILDEITALIKRECARRVGFEASHIRHGLLTRITSCAQKVQFVPLYDIVEDLRVIKDPQEIDAIGSAIRLAKRTLAQTLRAVGPRTTERDMAADIAIAFLRKGARAGFDPIVAAGKNSAKPHARPTDTVLKKQSFVMIDIGCELDHYNSDLTRTVILGTIHDTIKRIHTIVRDAHDRAIDTIRPGVCACDIDRAARSCIERAGYGAYFGHAVGHGVGREVHEKPSISVVSKTRLRPGMVFTIEPAIYIPGFGGVRIEDMVLVTKKGCEVLTRP